ncbi:MAG: YihY/virulence factor BrkB family protein [Betaproteobacteria bacterium]
MSGQVRQTHAASPAQISRHGWRDVLKQTLRAMAEQRMSLSAAGIAFYVVWAFFPALAMIVVLAAQTLGKAHVLAWLSSVRPDLPDSFNVVVIAQLDALAERSRGLSIVTAFGAFAFALWSGMRGARALMAALNLVYDERERRGFWHRQALALALCLAGGAFVLGALTLIVGFAALNAHGASRVGPMLLAPTRWPILIVTTLLLLSIAYRYGPCRRVAKWRWVTWGATVSATIWVVGSSALSYYASHWGQLNPLLGSLGMVMIFLFWCYLTVLIVLLGAQLNAELERHTESDTSAHVPRGAA